MTKGYFSTNNIRMPSVMKKEKYAYAIDRIGQQYPYAAPITYNPILQC